MLRWRKVKTVIRREYLARVRTKAFWISTLLVPVLLVTFAVVPSLLARRTGGSYTVALVSADDTLAARVAAEVAQRTARDRGRAGEMRITLRALAPTADAQAQRAELKREVVAKRLDGVVIVPGGGASQDTIEYLATNVTAFRLMNALERSVEAAVWHQRLTGAGLRSEQVAELTRRVELLPVRVGDDLSESRESAMQSFFLAYSLMFLLWFSVMIYGFYVMRGVLEEKSSRIVEVIVANLSPFELMVGKILGVGAVGLTQYAIWVVLAMNLAVPGLLAGVLGEGAALNITPTLLAFFVLFFVLGYMLYSTLYAAVGAAFNSEEEAQQMQSVAGWIMGLPFVLMFPIMSNPNSTFSTVISMVPVFAPMLYFLRLSVQTPPLWQTLLCIGLLIGTTAVVARVAAVIYRVGILMYGKRPSVKEVFGWVRGS